MAFTVIFLNLTSLSPFYLNDPRINRLPADSILPCQRRYFRSVCEFDAEFADLLTRQDGFPADILVLAGSFVDDDPLPLPFQNQRSFKLSDCGDNV